MSRIARLAAVVAAVALLGLAMAHFAGLFEQRIAPGAGRPRGDVVVEAGRWVPVQSVEEVVVEQASGTVQARRETLVSARITAAIGSVQVRAGDAVAAGEVLVLLDRRDLEARLEQQEQAVAAARARLAEAASAHQRVAALLPRGLVSGAELDRAEAALGLAEAELGRSLQAAEEARTALSFAEIRAPIAGRVVERLAEPGDMATPAAPLVRLYDATDLRLEADVRESLAGGLAKGQTVQARVEALGETFTTRVDEIVPTADPGSRSFLVKVGLPPHPRLYPGMFGRLLIPAGTTRRLYIPAGAVGRVGQLEMVMVEIGDGAVRRFVRTGIRTPDGQVEILSGLAPGERVLTEPS